ncbi:unnamed protein product, partial [Prorocentrum cordatum]
GAKLGTKDTATLEQQQSYADQEEAPNTKDHTTHEKKRNYDDQEETLNTRTEKQQNRDDQDPALGTKDTTLEQQSFTDQEEALNTKDHATHGKQRKYDGLDETPGVGDATTLEQQSYADQEETLHTNYVDQDEALGAQGREDNAAREVPPTFIDLVHDVVRMRLEEGRKVTAPWMCVFEPTKRTPT